MFSPATTNTPAASVRTSRRRQRPIEEDGSIHERKAKRTRSTLHTEVFVRPEDRQPEMAETKAQLAVMKQQTAPEISGPQKDIVVRGKKHRSGERSNKSDGNTVLTENLTYTVSKLLAVPEGLLANTTTGKQHGAIYADSGYALTLTHTHATVWLYHKNTSPPVSYTFDIPHSSQNAYGPLPIGSLVTPPASSPEPGLVVVASGKITYWESISSAATMGLRLQRNGVELSIPGLGSSETVFQILNAENAGFILAFSTGRIAYMNVRDGQGRPSISVIFLKGVSGSSGSGLFGGWRNALSVNSSKDTIAAVRAGRPKESGVRKVVVATTNGKIQSYDVHRGGHANSPSDAGIDGREKIVQAIKQAIPASNALLIENFQLLDFAVTAYEKDDIVDLLLLVSLTEHEKAHYFLVEAKLKGELITSKIRPIKFYTTPVNRDATSNTRLYLPHPELAYIVFDRSVIVISLANPPESPDSQLRMESHLQPPTFEDVVQFRTDMEIGIVGSGMEALYEPSANGMETFKSQSHGPKYPAAVLLVRGVGIVRIAATDIASLKSKHTPQVTAKSKLEQAVFFGAVPQNPISFTLRPEFQFPSEEIGEAALDFSQDILRSKFVHIPSVPARVSDNLSRRSAALRDLAQYLTDAGVKLDRVTRWRLLWDAEKMAAATHLWNGYDRRIASKPKGQKRGLITDIVESIHEDYKTEPVAEEGELDRVRQWFIKDVWNLGLAVPWAYQVIKYTYQDGQKDHDFVVEMLSEANDVLMGILQTAFKFREDNIKFYGLRAEPLENGVLTENYEDLPEFWTSTLLIVEAVRKQIELAGALLKEYWGKPDKPGSPNPEMLNKLRGEHPDLLDVAIRTNNERVRYCLAQAQNDPQFQIEADQLRGAQEELQDYQIVSLARDFLLPNEAIELAEKHEILKTLAIATMLEVNECQSKLTNRQDPVGTRKRFALLQDRVAGFFEKFGRKWATAFYNLQIEADAMANLLNGFKDQQTYLTSFLRDRPEYAKIGWIHEITREKNFDEAAKALLGLGLKREQDVWSKKVELSIGKLARLAKGYALRNRNEVSAAQDQLDLIKIQDTVYDCVLPSMEAAIDENAELQLALEMHRYRGLQSQPTFSNFLEQRMAALINHQAMDALSLVDLLTLMDAPEGHEYFRYQQFYLALQATQYGIADNDERVLVQRVIWRRCMLRDDWSELNNTDMKADEQVSDQVRNTALYQTIRACLKNRLGLIDNKESTVSPRGPEEIAGAYTDELDHRFTGLDASIQDRIMRDYQMEDDQFTIYREKCRLDHWYKTVLEQANEDYKEEIKEETEDGKNMQDARHALEDIEKSITAKEVNKAQGLLQSRPRYKPKGRGNGNAGSFRTSIRQY
ncbi:Nucleoporin [Lachnellula suecica]|uniref:Nucleoporin n=1 Tax=Lachnellula suecica TaxID=602035 RepID=A0A8T9BWU7_9HELO|nr:Nucleoporin [Lachnellula suecica]